MFQLWVTRSGLGLGNIGGICRLLRCWSGFALGFCKYFIMDLG